MSLWKIYKTTFRVVLAISGHILHSRPENDTQMTPLEHQSEIEILSNRVYFLIWTWLCQNVSKEVLLTGPKFQVKFQSHFVSLRSGRGTVTHPPSKDEGLNDIGHCMALDKRMTNFGSQ